jgi:sulfoxide reductase heme-binding subunit YedZ
LSFGTAYVALVLLAISLSLGPLNLLRSRPNPVHSALRRDAGICAGVAALLHTVLGLQVHMGGVISRYFIPASPLTRSGLMFAATNYAGLLSAVILLVLVVISNDIGIRRLGLDRWKRIQRLAYVAAAAAVVHGLVYQSLEKRSIIGFIVVFLIATEVMALQLEGRSKRIAERAVRENV